MPPIGVMLWMAFTEQGHPPGRPRLDGRRTADPDHVVQVGPDAYFTEMVEELRRRQRAGELAEDLDPAYVLLMLFAAALARR
jgi:hypothetical protein